MTLLELIAYLEANFKDSQEAKDLIEKLKDGIPPTLEQVQDFVTKDPEAIKWIAAERDRAVSKGVATYEANTLPKKIEEATKDMSKKLSPTDQRIADLEKREADRDSREKTLTLENHALTLLAEKKLPASLAKQLIGTDEESTTGNITLLEAEIKLVVDEQVKERLKTVGKVPTNDDHQAPGNENPWAEKSFNLTQQALLMKSDLDKAKRLAKEAGKTLKL